MQKMTSNEKAATPFEWFCLFALMVASACTTCYGFYLLWDYIAVIASLLASGVITTMAFEILNEEGPLVR